MAIYINMDRKLLRKGGRTAYSMAEGDLMGLLENALQRFRYNGSTDADMLLYNALSEFRGEAPFQKVCKDIEKIEVDHITKDYLKVSSSWPLAVIGRPLSGSLSTGMAKLSEPTFPFMETVITDSAMQLLGRME